jgi:asparagine N-glycosylation enzyme membrane subunit Stt3
MNTRDRAILGLVLIFVLGLATRIYLEKYTYIFGFDSYWFARMASYVIRYGHVPAYDPVAWRGSPPMPINWEISMDFPAWAYKLFYGSQYVMMHLLTVFKWLPATFGATGSLIMGAFGWVLGWPVYGFLTGFFAATNPGYIYRTLSGFYEDDATSFFIPLAFLFAYLAYRSKDRKKYWFWTGMAGLTLLVQAISWDGFLIVPYTVVVFSILYLAYVLVEYLKRYIPEKMAYWDWIVMTLGGVAAVLVGWIIKRIAYAEATDALTITGALTPTTIYTLATPYLAIFLWGMAATATVLWLKENDRKYIYVALSSVVAALFTYSYPVNAGFRTVITDASGLAHPVGFTETSYGMMLLGSLLMILAATTAGAFAAHLYRKEKKGWSEIIDWKLLGVVLIPLLIAAFSGPINGNDWYSPVITVISNILPEAGQGAAVSANTVRPHMGFIEPKTSGPWSNIIGEETYGFANWPAKYGILALLAMFSIPFVFHKVEKDRYFLFLLAWIALGWWASWYKLKFAYYFGLPIALAAAAMLDEVFTRIKARPAKAATLAVIGMISLSMVSTALYHTATRIPTLLTTAEAQEMNLAPKGLPLFSAQPAEDYLAMFKWIDANTPKDANLLNWWSIGHWLTFFTERGVMTDNTNHYKKADDDVARFFLATDENTAYSIAKKYGMNYVIFQSEFLWQTQSFALYALGITDLRDPRLQDYGAGIARCQRFEKSPVTGRPYYLCNVYGQPFTLDENQWNMLPPFSPLTYTDSNTAIKITIGDHKFVAYTMGDGKNAAIVLLTPKVNDSMIVKMLLGVPMEHFQKVWESDNQHLMIYKVR